MMMQRMHLPHNITGLPATLFSYSIAELDGERATEYSMETTTQRDLTHLQQHFE